jgi:amidophosphoribosyltransferase
MSRGKLLAVREPARDAAACLGRIGDTVVFASESCALDAVDATFVRDLDPVRSL